MNLLIIKIDNKTINAELSISFIYLIMQLFTLQDYFLGWGKSSRDRYIEGGNQFHQKFMAPIKISVQILPLKIKKKKKIRPDKKTIIGIKNL